MKRLTPYLFMLTLCCADKALAQHQLYVQSTAAYARQIKVSPAKRLVEITKVVPDIKLDIRYATANNFMHRTMYAQARAFARAPVVDALKQVEAELKTKGLGLKIFDAYRPYAVTVAFFKMARDTNFVANPKLGSKHNRGCAVDLTLINLKTGKELAMPTGFDSFSRKAAANYPNISAEELQNRELLKAVMQAHGFKVLKTEWWHYDFNGWQKEELMDVPFEKL